MKKICSLHLQAIYNAGVVRQVDRILVELLMAQFTRVNQMMGADLNTSLQEFFTVMFFTVVESHNSRLYMSVTKVLVFLDCVR